MSEPTSRLNLIQRAMQRVSPPRTESIHADNAAAPDKPEGQQQAAFSEQKTANGAAQAAPMQHPAAGTVRLDYAKLRASRIVTPDNKSSSTYNEFRSIKRKLLPMIRDPDGGTAMRNVVMVTSALPGEGKTFTVMNLAIGLAAERNLDVILVDGDMVRGSIAEYFQGDHEEGLIDLLTEKRQRIDDVLHTCSDVPGLHVLFAGKHNDASPELLASARMAEICAALSGRFQRGIVIIDTSPVLATSEPTALAMHAHHLIMLVAAGKASRHHVQEALAEVSRCPSISLLFNQSPEWQRPLSYPYYYGYGQGKP